MSKRTSFTLAAAFVLLAACGKNKSDDTTPIEPDPALSGVDADIAPIPQGDEASEATAADAGVEAQPATIAPPKTLTATIQPRSKSKLSGTVVLTEKPDGVELAITLADVKGAGPKGMHLHQTADCSAPDAKSAGDHWNPENHQHGLPEAPQKHLGDLGNIEVQKDGTATTTITVPGGTLGEGDKSLVGRALVIHAKKDDGKTQPSGASGDRIGCAEIK